jgi:hypothetical protein
MGEWGEIVADFGAAVLPDLAVIVPLLVVFCLLVFAVCLLVDGLWGVYYRLVTREARRKSEHFKLMKRIMRDWQEENESTPGVIRTHDLRISPECGVFYGTYNKEDHTYQVP